MRYAVGIIMVAALCFGCATTYEGKYAQVSDTYTTALNTISDLRKADMISSGQVKEILPTMEVASVVIDEFEVAVQASDIVEAETLYARARFLLKRIAAFLEKYYAEEAINGPD